MLARVCLSSSRAVSQIGLSSSLRASQQGLRFPSVTSVPSRPLMVYLSGLDCDKDEDEENARNFAEDSNRMGCDPYPFWKKVYLLCNGWISLL